MESRKKDLVLAKKIQRKCYSKFLKEKSEQMEGILTNESKLIYNIPKQIIGSDIKKDFMRART